MGFFSSIGKALSSGVSSAVGGLPGAAVNAGLGLISSNYQNKAQQRNAKYWADYNSPASQMARLREAGLNPNLVYGNGATATAEGATSVDSPKLSSKYDSLSQMMALSNMNAQRGVLESQKALNEANATKSMQETENLKKQGDLTSADIKLRGQQYESEAIKTEVLAITRDISKKFGLANAEQENLRLQAERTVAQINASFAPKLNELRLKEGNAKVNSLIAQASSYYASVKEAYQRVKTLQAQAELFRQQKEESKTHVMLNYVEDIKRGLEISKLDFERKCRDVGITNPSQYSPDFINRRVNGEETEWWQVPGDALVNFSNVLGKDIIAPLLSFFSVLYVPKK